MRANWSAVLTLVFIFVIALLVRSYFAFEMSADNGYIVSGGSDSYYWMRIIDYHVETGDSLYWDSLINFPDGIRNPRPPFYSMSVALPAVAVSDLFSSMDDAIGFMLVWSTAFWGALTVIPVYFLGKEAFSRRAGLIAAFVLAFMPSHVQRSVLSNADHDAFILFFIVLTFYFLLKAVKAQQHIRWVQNWRSLGSIRSGLKAFFEGSHTAILYALLGGTAFGCVIMAWVGFAYVAVLILAYLLIQTLLNRFKDVDSLSVTLLVTIAMGFGYLISFPVYYEQSLVNVRFDVPVYLFLAAIFFAGMFVVSRDYPWTMTLPTIGMVTVVGVLGISAFSPEFGEAIMSGQGYFVQNKLYSTIAEARAPVFSELAMSFGMVTFFISLIGLFYALVKIPKQTTAEYIFIVVWLGAAIFMAMSAGRFMFNAAPAFALAAGWILVMVIDTLDFGAVRKSLKGASGSFLQVFRKSVKIRHIVGALFLAFFIVMPNVWFSVDAGIPSESKRDYDREIYESMPSFMRPGDYDVINGSLKGGSSWYLGAFGYSLPLPSQYFPAAWDWFSQQDQDVLPATERPAYVAWWDYGFEAVEAGQHPTVADNFQNGYELTGSAIMAQGEEDAIALFAYRLIQCSYGRVAQSTTDALEALFERHGISVERMQHVLQGPGDEIVDEVLSDPDKYGPMANDLNSINARIVAGRTELANIGSDALVAFYDDLCDLLDWEIRYFNVDARMFPIAATNTGIFYAPAKLSDRRISDGGSIPIDFFEIMAVTDRGTELPLDSVTPDMTIVNYAINYSEMFYDSMFYRAMAGFSASDLGLEDDDGLPGYSGSLQSYTPMPGWGLSHFRVVYRTAYYNPYPSDLVPYHADSWTAVSYDEAMELKDRITAGEIEGVIDVSAGSLYKSGLVFLEYYHGAYVNGTVTTEEGLPVAGARLTVQDEYGIPHDTVLTDENGTYSVLAPFGDITLVLSSGGAVDAVKLQGSSVMESYQFDVTDAQAMRLKQDLDYDGIYDYLMTKDFVVEGGEVSGDVYWDIDRDGNLTTDVDLFLDEATIYAEDTTTGRIFTTNVSQGYYDLYLPPGQYSVKADVYGTEKTVTDEVNVTSGDSAVLDLSLVPGGVEGYVSMKDGSPASGLELALRNAFTGRELVVTTGVDGYYAFPIVLDGKYALESDDPDLMVFSETMTVDAGYVTDRNVTAQARTTMSFHIVSASGYVPYAAYSLVNVYYPSETVAGTADRFGRVQEDLPAGYWTLYSVHSTGFGNDLAGYASVDTFSSDSVEGTLVLETAYMFKGSPRTPSGVPAKYNTVQVLAEDGTRLITTTNKLGEFELRLPAGTYDVLCWYVAGKNVYSGSVDLYENISYMRLWMEDGIIVSGNLWLDQDSSGSATLTEAGAYALVEVTDAYGRVYTTRADDEGEYRTMVIEGTRLQVSLATPGYSGWSFSGLFGDDSQNVTLVAAPDPVVVTGRVLNAGIGVRNVQISFLPDDVTLDAVYVVSGADGRYTASLAPSGYHVVIDQAITYTGSLRLQLESTEAFAPSGEPIVYDLAPAERVAIYGNVLGASSEIDVSLSGPEEPSVSVSLYSYTAYAVPGLYNITASGMTGSNLYVGMVSAYVEESSREFDVYLERAYELSGRAYIGTSPATKPVTATVTSEAGASMTALSDSSGTFSFDVASGTYEVSCVYESVRTEDARILYIEYVSTDTVEVAMADATVDSVLTSRLDNTTFAGVVRNEYGVPVSAKISLIPNTDYGLGTTVYAGASGAYSAQVQPGDYTVYVRRSQTTQVYLGHLEIARNNVTLVDISLEEGRYLSGTMTAGGDPISAQLTISQGSAAVEVAGDPEGYFYALLPAGTYELSSNLEKVEAGMTIDYSVSRTLEVGQDDVYAKMSFDRQSTRSVEAYWNSSLALPAIVGKTVTYSFVVENTGNIGDDFACTYTGTGFSVAFTPEEQFIDFGTNGNKASFVAEVTVLEGALAGNTTVPVLIKSTSSSAARATLNLVVKVSPVHNSSISISEESDAVTSSMTRTTISVTNNGNIADDYSVEITNVDALAERGWSVRLISTDTEEPAVNFTLEVGDVMDLHVEYTALRSDPDPSAEATVVVSPRSDPGGYTIASVPILLPDLSIGPGDLEVIRDDISYEYDATNLYVNIGLVCAIGALVASFLILRKRKGLGKKRGEKK